MNNASDSKQLLSIKLLDAGDVAQLLGIHVRTLWRWSSSGTLPEPVRIGRVVRWRFTDLQAFLEKQLGGGQ